MISEPPNVAMQGVDRGPEREIILLSPRVQHRATREAAAAGKPTRVGCSGEGLILLVGDFELRGQTSADLRAHWLDFYIFVAARLAREFVLRDDVSTSLDR